MLPRQELDTLTEEINATDDELKRRVPWFRGQLSISYPACEYPEALMLPALQRQKNGLKEPLP